MSDALLISNESVIHESTLNTSIGSMDSSEVSSSYALALAAVLSAGFQSHPDFPDQTHLSEGSGSSSSTYHNQESSERRKKKPYKELTLEEKVQLIRLAEENAGMSQAAIAERYSIAKSNVCRILQRKREYLRAFESAGFAGSRKRKLKATDIRETDFHSERQRKEIGSDTLRGHMYAQHGVARMFMCRCCNWAFPDKKALELHIQLKDEMAQTGGSSPQSISKRAIGDVGSSAFSPLRPIPINNNTLPPHFGLTQGIPMPIPSLPLFSSPLGRPSEEVLSRIRERVMLNALLGPQSSLTPSWLSSSLFPLDQQDKSPTQLQCRNEECPEDIINVENDETLGMDENSQPSGSESEDARMSGEQKSSSTLDLSTSINISSTQNSPIENVIAFPGNMFKKEADTPSAFHPMLKIEPRTGRNEEAPEPVHISPSDSHTSGSSPGSCNGTSSCFECSLMRSRAADCEQRMRFLEETRDHLQAELLRTQGCILNTESIGKVNEREMHNLRDENQRLKQITQQARHQITNYLSCGAVSHETRTILESLNRIF
ncbi:unnamed protein product, partial [Mesorhabditis belari]|uniref:HTH psq-type domain-containing protein n=1 Tax=Mesorhabditis belari TaxID=2138241 RepID=A0AAF3E8G7_9BILA